MKISMRLFQRKMKNGSIGPYYIEFDNGQRRSLKTRDKEKAERAFRKIRNEYLKGRVVQLTGGTLKTLEAFKTEYLKWAEEALNSKSTFRANRLGLNKLIEHAGESTRLDRISVKHIDMMVAHEKHEGTKIRSINNYIRHARAVLNKAVEWQYLTKNPLADAKELSAGRSIPRFIRNRSDIPRFINKVKDWHLRMMIIAYLATGRRRSEILSLDWRDIDLDAGDYKVRTKGGAVKVFRVNALFRSVLMAMVPKKEGRVFDRWRHPDTISHMVKAELVAAGHPDLTLHSLRHTYASVHATDGKTKKEVQALLGHDDPRATEIYSHFFDGHMAEISEVNLGPIDMEGNGG